ncbi:unnamed protein product [Effrenium voratum]|nr:unnamed protein product [Effrenium voratum]
MKHQPGPSSKSQAPTAMAFSGPVPNMPPPQDSSALKRGRRAQELLRDAERVYDPKQERQWEGKYKFFSELKMKVAYRTYARARHDPFNKDPAWGRSVLARFADYCTSNNIKFEDIFAQADLNSDQSLSRPEIKHALHRVLPSLSDQEVIAVFDVIDEDKSGAVSVQEFVAAMDMGKYYSTTPTNWGLSRRPSSPRRRWSATATRCTGSSASRPRASTAGTTSRTWRLSKGPATRQWAPVGAWWTCASRRRPNAWQGCRTRWRRPPGPCATSSGPRDTSTSGEVETPLASTSTPSIGTLKGQRWTCPIPEARKCGPGICAA